MLSDEPPAHGSTPPVPLATSTFTRLDHVGIAVWSADRWIPYYRDTLGLPLVGDEPCEDPGTRLVYFDAGNMFIQLVAPVRADCDVRDWLAEHGEGLHHICLAADDLETVRALPGNAGIPVFRGGRGHMACFLADSPEGVSIEVIETGGR